MLWTFTYLNTTEIYDHVAFLPSGERERNRTMRNQASAEGVAKRWHVVFPVPLGQEESDVQGCFVAVANSSYAKAQDAYDESSRVGG
jgi:hypothetical protein